MLRWDGDWVEGPNGDMVRRGDSPQAQQKPEPKSWEAHRRHRTYDQRGVVETETHEAIRIKYQRRVNPRKMIGPGGGTDPSPLVAIGLGTALHGACWWLTASTWAFAPSPWWALVPFAVIPVILGVKFWIANVAILWLIGSLFIAFNGYAGWIMLLPAAGVIAPGKWVKGEW